MLCKITVDSFRFLKANANQYCNICSIFSKEIVFNILVKNSLRLLCAQGASLRIFLFHSDKC